MLDDVSYGFERIPVKIASNVDIAKVTENWQYAQALVSTAKGIDLSTFEILSGCDCVGQCGKGCTCLTQMRHEIPYTKVGSVSVLRPEILDAIATAAQPLFECNNKCRCSATCSNRLVQLGLVWPLEICSTQGKGYGVKTLENIPRGAFVCEYTGEVIPTAEAQCRQKEYDLRSLNYLLVLREVVPSTGKILRTNIDATHCGNVARFLNHSCDPNLELAPVRVHSLIPHLAFFALRDISRGEELTFRYGKSSLVTSLTGSTRRVPCRCGCATCEGFLPFDDSA